MTEALELAGLGDLLASRPKGLDSRISETGVGLSGGQARRLSLARLFLNPAKLILMDEPTAGLDRETEQVLVDSLGRLASQGRTLVFATHHGSLLMLASRVVTLRRGRLING
jgi:ATP-binding cassette subfamily C protein CydD